MELPEFNITELQEKFDSRELTAVKLCEAFLQRLEKLTAPVQLSAP